ncbi:DUF1553 domain-containing protein [Pleomorphovibrio marinus]|uniref:DUF1553 domain-containing protein n=1 Tax=Pleomorphovibrio marinus TaxID=2164132 RepID=UPI001E6171EE|nr:DUF1553 domain-containing protein [Pleomorphovibrio marinus]
MEAQQKPIIILPTYTLYRISFLLVWMVSSCGIEKPEEIKNAASTLPSEIDYNLHVKPILSDRCFSCHGPDPNTREAGLRLDTEEGAYAALEGNRWKAAIKPGKLSKSEVYGRIISSDPEYMMPPPVTNLTLSTQEKAILVRWIEQGAKYKPHWAFIKPTKPELPTLQNPDWPKNEIDHFVLAKLESEGMSPSQEADKMTLLRRISLDLTGLLPDEQLMNSYQKDSSPDAYEKAVDHLLASSAHAERMALDWLDVSRYADSHGLHADGYRMMWPWRDWVIKSFKENMPYDQFIQMQIAGDLMPDTDKEKVLATAFNRNHQMTAEGGIIDEEYRLEYVFDRAETTSKALLGLTMECARCHDHKFDPVSQKDYFSLAAFYNNVEELGMTGDDGNAGPMMLFMDEKQEEEILAIKKRILLLEEKLKASEVGFNPPQTYKDLTPEKTLQKGLLAHFELEGYNEGKTYDRFKKQAMRVSGSPESKEGAIGKSLRFKHDYDILELDGEGLFELHEPFSYAIWVNPETIEPFRGILGNSGNKNNYWRGYEMTLDSLNRVSIRIIHALPHNCISLISEESLPVNSWTHLAFTYDGSGKADGVGVYINGKPALTTTLIDNLYKSIIPVDNRYIQVERPLRLARSYRVFSGDDGIFPGSLDELYIYNRELSEIEVASLAGAALPEDKSTWSSHYNLHRNANWQKLREELQQERFQWLEVMNKVDEVMVMQESQHARTTYILDRGEYNLPTEPVEANIPEVLPDFKEEWPRNRLGLALWLTHQDNPLTARVAVNRYWYQLFGRGIVNTVDDFGSQGELPSHPELLDWLAVEFMESGWDLRGLIKKIVMSATYRQQSTPGPDLLERDPNNILLARGARHRLIGEFIRDAYLQASGLLNPKIGGPSVKPYQPEGLWEEKGEFSHVLLKYIQDKGDDLYRRSMYTFIRRTSPPPAMSTFDVPNREECSVMRQETSTPLQPLVLMNDPQVVEASRILAERMQKEGGSRVEDQIQYGFMRALSRNPNEKELATLMNLYEKELERFSSSLEDARKLLRVGEYPSDQKLPVEKTAALAMVSNLMFNHYDFYTKQ